MEGREQMDLLEHADVVNSLLARYGVKFGIYKNNTFHEQLFPFDPIPRVIGKEEFDYLERGLKQRVKALNLFLKDIYNEKKILKDKVVPEEFIYASSGYLAQCEGIIPSKGVYSHISGIDLVLGKDGTWYILEDNLRVPSGASYPMIARELCRRSSPKTFRDISVADNRSYAQMLKKTLDYVNTGGLTVVMTPGRYNAAYFEHSYLAEKMKVPLVTSHDLIAENDRLYFIDYSGKKEQVGAVYRRISDEYMDPMNFNRESVIGVPHIFDIYRKGNVAIVNAPGNGVADDKGIYYFVPKMIRYYLDEEPILHNAPTYLPYYEEDMKYVLENFDKLVLKDVAEAGGYGVVFGSSMSKKQKEDFLLLLQKEPRRFIAQEVIDFCDLPILEKGEELERKADLRAFVLSEEEQVVWKSGLTRFSRNPDSFIVNSSQGGGFKDTSEPVAQHSFTVRCTLPSDERQTVLQQNIHILPKEFLCENKDSFGNVYFFGRTQAAHTVFEVVTEGIVLTGCSEGTKAEEEYRLGMFVGQTAYTKPDEEVKKLFQRIKLPNGTNLEKSVSIMEALRKEFSYEAGTTNFMTTAAQAWAFRRGVCQDYSHVMLSLCRMAGIPCRYVAGMLIGEGLSHAWVEIEDDGIWYGLDPTNGTKVLEDHIKISHGRDYEDCLINQGVFTGNATQTQTVSVCVQEEIGQE